MPYYKFTATQADSTKYYTGYAHAKDEAELREKVYQDELTRGHPLTIISADEVRGKNVPEVLREDLIEVMLTASW